MHIILTHEQADFDAIASLLGASLISDKAIPILPRRVNRNVRSFINIYQPELPFIEPRDFTQITISDVTLVDTQSMVTLKGITKKTRVSVIDHHKIRKTYPKDWQIKTDQVGACTTLFVEHLRDQNVHLSSIYSTLLLLGIYEDTGSLTYGSTSPRDAHAVAFLLEQGANLSIANQFLNPPLSPEQRDIYDKLLAASSSYYIHGKQVIVSTTIATTLVEELSSIAHKLRDLLDPDILIIAVKTIEGIRLIGRSTTDQVDVSRIMAEFGGGGHERAASALVHIEDDQPSLVQIQERLIVLLNQQIKPSVTVGQIMSRKPLTLTPDISVQRADHLMLRYGYEGYPVVKDGKIIGLLTRRAVDRALSHKLNLSAESLMEAGEITISPNEPLEHLQKLMASSGWGQIPVVDPVSNKIIGIVTRTDLLKTLGKGFMSVPGRQNLFSRLSNSLPTTKLELLRLFAKIADEHHFPIYIVGGFVRDLLLNRPNLDFDIVVEGDAISFAGILADQFGGRMITHGRFGTAKWQIDGSKQQLLSALPPDSQVSDIPDALDLISARTEFYEYPTALPTIERSSIKLDLHRRDFTINTLALRLDGRHFGDLYDFWGGLNDIQKSIIRVLHSLSFVDDPTRMLRAIRFEQRFGFQIDERTLQLMKEAKSLLKQLSGDRIRHEFNLIFAEERPHMILARMHELGLLTEIHPALGWDDITATNLIHAMYMDIPEPWHIPGDVNNLSSRRVLAYLIWMARIPLESIIDISIRLRIPRPIRKALQDLSLLLQEVKHFPSLKPSEITSRVEGLSPLVLYAAWILADSNEIRQILETAHTLWINYHPLINGESLRKLGIPPGPAYKYILTNLRNAHLDGEIETNEEELLRLDEIIHNLPEEYIH